MSQEGGAQPAPAAAAPPARQQPDVDLRPVYQAVQSGIMDIMALAGEVEEEYDSHNLKRSRVQAKAKQLLSIFSAIEDSIAKHAPARTAADVELEIKELEEELKEKNALIRKVRAKMDGWSKRFREGEEGV